MNETMITTLRAMCADPEAALRRFAGNTSLYRRFLLKFVEDSTMRGMNEALVTEDWDGMLKAAHTLKGVAGSLGLTPLYNASSEIVSVLRTGNTQAARTAFDTLQDAYTKLCTAINQMKEDVL